MGVAIAPLMASSLAVADEGMWTFDNFPTDQVQKTYGQAPTAEWLDRTRLASVQLGNGCSASFVSGDGLMLTNHHCANRCIEEVSTRRRDYAENGFYAARARDERRCPGLSAARLEAIEDVSERVKKATADQEGEAFKSAERKVMAEIEGECAKDEKTRCDVIRLYNGGRFHLYRYRRFTDVRLVFAPEDGIARFGGDPDNFEFPRYGLDMTLLRAYDAGKPAKVDTFLEWSKTGVQPNELVYVSGHPRRTQRSKTVAQLAFLRDVLLAERLMELGERKGVLSQFRSESREKARVGKVPLQRTDNLIKAYLGRRRALLSEDFFAKLVVEELQFRQRLLESEDRKEDALAWSEIAAAIKQAEAHRVEAEVMEHHRGFGSVLVSYAWTLVRSAQEREKPSTERLPEYADSKLPGVEAYLSARRPIYPALEEALLRWGLNRAREQLGPDEPFIRKLLDNRSPAQQAAYLIKKTRLGSPKLRKRLYEGGWEAVSKSKDPLIVLVRSIEDDGRAVRAWYEAEVEPTIQKNERRIADARFALYGTSVYPDATGSLRLTYGKVTGFKHRGQDVAPFTYAKGLRERATGVPPFRLPPRWRRAVRKFPDDLPINLVSTNDIINGNSGSPLINAKGELVGLVFDGNRYSLGGAYGFDPILNRAVSVHVDFMRTALKDVYKARRLVEELKL